MLLIATIQIVEKSLKQSQFSTGTKKEISIAIKATVGII